MALPPSPTLTNPDMILPYGGYDDTTPSPPRVGAWSVKPEDMDFSQGLTYGVNGGMPMVPITPIIYGNGTMLSDIGEVTEAESTIMGGIGARRHQARMAKNGGAPLGSSPTVPYQSVIMAKKKALAQHKRNVSSESGSTVMTERDTNTTDHFKDFDDTVSVCESAFQGDDEESLADYSFGEPMVAETKTIYGKRESKVVDLQKQKQEEESSAALSRRAEMILANAKKRLDNMEGNLNRARSSLHITPSASMSSIHSSSPLSRDTPSPPQQRIVPQNGAAPARHRQLANTSLQTFGHQRISSENSLPSPVKPVPTSRTFLSGKPLDPTPRYSMPARADSYDSGRSLSAMQSRSSDPSATKFAQDSGSGSDGGGMSPFGADRYIRSATAEPSYHHEIHRQSLERSSSTTEMRDLTDKMKDLKGKISTLRDRAREDHLKRRSASNLRTPSPFTAAEQWYTSSNDYKDGHLTADAIARDQWIEPAKGSDEPPREVLISENGRIAEGIAEEYEESVATTVYHEFEDEKSEPSETYDNVATSFGDADPLNQRAVFDTDESEAETEERNTSMMEEYADEVIEQQQANELANERGYDSDGGDSVYHDTVQAPVLSHEEREDAFDYEHFFLHSAMGTMSQERQRRRRSIGSDMSDDSTATERAIEPQTAPPVSYTPPVSYKDQLKPTGHKRQQSQDTISTMATFATAKGDSYADADEDEDDEDEEASDYDIHGVFPLIPGQGVIPSQEVIIDTKQSSPTIPDETERAKTPPYIPRHHSRRSSVVFQMKDGIVQRSTVHRPSVSSFHSATGSTRSFPLVNKPKTSASSTTSSIKTPSIRSAPKPVVDANGQEFPGMALTTDVDDDEQQKLMEARLQPSPVSMLRRDEQIMVERLVASMGKCVLALQESREGTVEHRLWRRRLDAARRVLEGIEGSV